MQRRKTLTTPSRWIDEAICKLDAEVYHRLLARYHFDRNALVRSVNPEAVAESRALLLASLRLVITKSDFSK